MARELPADKRQGCRAGQPRPCIHKQCDEPHHRNQLRQDIRLQGQVRRVRHPPCRTPRTAAACPGKPATRDCRRQSLHRTLPLPGNKGHTGAAEDTPTGEDSAHRGGRSGQQRPAPQVHVLAAQRRLPRHLRRSGQELRRPLRVPRREPADKAWREGGLRRSQRRRQDDARQVHHGRNSLRRHAQGRPQRADRLLRTEPGTTARRRTDRLRHHRPRRQGRHPPEDTRHPGRLHVRRRGRRQEGEVPLWRRTHTSGYD